MTDCTMRCVNLNILSDVFVSIKILMFKTLLIVNGVVYDVVSPVESFLLLDSLNFLINLNS